MARSLCTKKTLKDVKKAERAWSKRPEGNKVVFKDWLHVFELEIQTFVNMNDIDKGKFFYRGYDIRAFLLRSIDTNTPWPVETANDTRRN